jgi:hypothetical protein
MKLWQKFSRKTQKKVQETAPKTIESRELADAEIENVSGGALNAYLTLSGQKQGQFKH